MGEADPGMELSDVERLAIERMRMTPAERRAAAEARLLQRLTPEQRQALEERRARIANMTPAQRRAYFVGRRLAGTARLMRRETDGLRPADALAAVEPASRADVSWLIDGLKSAT